MNDFYPRKKELSQSKKNKIQRITCSLNNHTDSSIGIKAKYAPRKPSFCHENHLPKYFELRRHFFNKYYHGNHTVTTNLRNKGKLQNLCGYKVQNSLDKKYGAKLSIKKTDGGTLVQEDTINTLQNGRQSFLDLEVFLTSYTNKSIMMTDISK